MVAEFTKRQHQSQQPQNHNQDTGDFDQISDERQLKQYADRKAREIASQYSNGQITDADRDMALFDIQTQYADRKAEILTDKKLKQFQETNTSQQTATTRQSMFNQLFEEAGLNQDSEFRNKFVELGGQGFFDYEAVRNGDPNALKTALKVVKQLSGIQQPSKTEYNQGGGFTPPTGANGTDVTPTNDGQPKGYQIDPAIAKIIMERAGNEKLGKSVLNRISQSINSKKAS